MSTTSSYLNTQLNNSPRNVNPGNKNMDFYLLKYPIFTDKLVFGSFSYLADPRFVVSSKFFPQSRLVHCQVRVQQMTILDPRPHAKSTLLWVSWLIRWSHIHLPSASEFHNSMPAQLSLSSWLGCLLLLSKDWNWSLSVLYKLIVAWKNWSTRRKNTAENSRLPD